MKTIKYIFKHFKMFLKQKRCSHESVDMSSCPFTGMTYKTCNACWKRISATKTND
jgi:hypothetical protein